MNASFRILFAGLVALSISATLWAGESLQIKLKDGTTWRGQVSEPVNIRFMQGGVEVDMAGTITKAGDQYIVVEGNVAGVKRTVTVFRTDIVSIKSDGATDAAAPSAAPTPDTKQAVVKNTDEAKPDTTASPNMPAKSSDGKPLGVFILPMSGMVGEGMRHEEIEAVAKEADKYGPGQIIVLKIKSGGGLAIEMEQIHFTMLEVRKRHRLVAWIEEAISAAAATALHCDEIYFQTTGVLGAMTKFAGGQSVQGEELSKWMEAAGKWTESGGRSKYIAWAMIDDVALLSYDKDPVTQKVTWYNDLSGEYDLSDEKTNLVFTATTATESRFADGIADTEEDLAELLNLPKWVELGNGRKIAADWMKIVDRANEEVPRLFARTQYAGTGSGDPIVIIGKQIQILKDLIQWQNRCPNVCFLKGVPPKEELERIIAQYQKQLADMKKAQQGR